MLFECPIYSRSWEIEKLQEKLRLLWIIIFFFSISESSSLVCLLNNCEYVETKKRVRLVN